MASVAGDVRDADALCGRCSRTGPTSCCTWPPSRSSAPRTTTPVETYAINVMGTVNLLEAARACRRRARGGRGHERQVLREPRVAVALPRGRPARRPRPLLQQQGVRRARDGGVPRLVLRPAARRAPAWPRDGPGGQRPRRRRLGRRTASCPTSSAPSWPASGSSLRYPDAVRPWQHVLDPLGGYLLLAQRLVGGARPRRRRGTSRPPDEDARTVRLDRGATRRAAGPAPRLGAPRRARTRHEARSLRLDASKARALLGWSPRLTVADTLAAVADWYGGHAAGAPARDLVDAELARYGRLVAVLSAHACRGCGAPLHRTFVDLGSQPLANSYLSAEDLNRMEPFYPLHVRVCDALLAGAAARGRVAREHLRRLRVLLLVLGPLAAPRGAVRRPRSSSASASAPRARSSRSRATTATSCSTSSRRASRCWGSSRRPTWPRRRSSAGSRRWSRSSAPRRPGGSWPRGGAPTWSSGNNVLAHVPDLNDFVEGLAIAAPARGRDHPGVPAPAPPDGRAAVRHDLPRALLLLLPGRGCEPVLRGRTGCRSFDVEELPTHGGSLRLYLRRSDEGAAESAAVAELRGDEAARGLTRPRDLRGVRARPWPR